MNEMPIGSAISAHWIGWPPSATIAAETFSTTKFAYLATSRIATLTDIPANSRTLRRLSQCGSTRARPTIQSSAADATTTMMNCGAPQA